VIFLGTLCLFYFFRYVYVLWQWQVQHQEMKLETMEQVPYTKRRLCSFFLGLAPRYILFNCILIFQLMSITVAALDDRGGGCLQGTVPCIQLQKQKKERSFLHLLLFHLAIGGCIFCKKILFVSVTVLFRIKFLHYHLRLMYGVNISGPS
jgi:hypothetical protein